ncbi:hypothetical protein ACJX0J_014076, partial [Zea mays]
LEKVCSKNSEKGGQHKKTGTAVDERRYRKKKNFIRKIQQMITEEEANKPNSRSIHDNFAIYGQKMLLTLSLGPSFL